MGKRNGFGEKEDLVVGRRWEGVGEVEAFEIGALAILGAESGEGEIDRFGGDGIPTVPEHLQHGAPRQKVAVALHAPVVHERVHAPESLYLHLSPLSLSRCSEVAVAEQRSGAGGERESWGSRSRREKRRVMEWEKPLILAHSVCHYLLKCQQS